MKILAIDYGTRFIGLALSNTAGTVVLPYSSLTNTPSFLENLKKIIRHEEVDKIVIGVPIYKKTTPFFKKLELFIEKLKNTLDIPIETQDELLTTQETRTLTQQEHTKNNHDLAAFIILKQYLHIP